MKDYLLQAKRPKLKHQRNSKINKINVRFKCFKDNKSNKRAIMYLIN
jgi:hypothetical protein